MLDKIFCGIEAEVVRMGYRGEYSDMEYDSRRIKDQGIFVALEGEKADGHMYVGQAVRNGAKLIIVSKDVETDRKDINIVKVKNTRKYLGRMAGNYYGNPEKDLKIIGITGTNGKTTTAYLLYKFLDRASFVGSIGIEIGEKRYPAVNTTPESLDIIRYALESKKVGMEYMVLEVSSQGIDNYRIEGLCFDGVIFTNLSREHLDYHGSMDEYFSVKERIFSHLKKNGKAVVWGEDEYGKILAGKYDGVVTYGVCNGDFRGTKIRMTLKEMECFIEGGGERVDVTTSLIGGYNLLNLTGAAAMVKELGESWDRIGERLSALKFIDGRMEIMEKNGIAVIIDYAHTEDALEKLLSTIKSCDGEKLYTLISGTGERCREKRGPLGEIAGRYSDFVVVSSNSPRGENPLEIAREVAKGIKDVPYLIETNRGKAVKRIIKMASKGDIVVLTGKGHERYQEIDGVLEEYSEAGEVRKVLATLQEILS